ncbi:unnamed protein product [Arabidopsis lyrata]|nr:unnamed protein product [Arabidopsis lyrata]
MAANGGATAAGQPSADSGGTCCCLEHLEGLKNTYGKHNETWIPKNTFTEPRLSHFKAVNPEVAQALEEAGLRFVGKDDTGKRVEVIEFQDHPFYVGVQFHPEFKAVLKFAQYTGANAIAGRHTPGEVALKFKSE